MSVSYANLTERQATLGRKGRGMDNTTAALLDVHRHSSWANQQLLTAAANLTPEQLRTPLGEGSIGDLLETLIHMYDAQLAWYDRARTGASGPSQTPEELPDIDSLMAAWSRTDEAMDEWLSKLTGADLGQSVAYRSFYGYEAEYTIRDMLIHQAFHSHQHRGEVALVLSQLGHSPGELDFIDYVNQHPAVASNDSSS